MKEIRDILKGYIKAKEENKKTALATVVHVEGSSYRRPGARMLVTEDGILTGAISGGCLEGDALRKALLAINQQENKLVIYDSTDEDDAKFGMQLGCNGVVYILFEPISEGNKQNPVFLFNQLIARRENAVLATLFSLKHNYQPGTRLLYRNDEIESFLSGVLKEQVLTDAKKALRNKASSVKFYQYNEREVNAFVEFIAPPVALVIAGAGNDVQPLVEITSILNWHTTVVDGRSTHATVHRFPKADRILTLKPKDILSTVEMDTQTVFVLMTHNYNYDIALLKELVTKNCSYIGILGPRTKLDRMFEELKETGIVMDKKQVSKIYSPVGLDIGAETSEEIAISIVAEIKAVLASGTGTSLRQKEVAIHFNPAKITEAL